MATTDAGDKDVSKTNDSGPFSGVRSFLWGIVILLVGASVAYATIGGAGLKVVFLALYVSAYLVALIGGLWFIDVILRYLKS